MSNSMAHLSDVLLCRAESVAIRLNREFGFSKNRDICYEEARTALDNGNTHSDIVGLVNMIERAWDYRALHLANIRAGE